MNTIYKGYTIESVQRSYVHDYGTLHEYTAYHVRRPNGHLETYYGKPVEFLSLKKAQEQVDCSLSATHPHVAAQAGITK